jgi:hypothetical protein
MTRAVPRLWGPIATALFVACVWLNQGIGHDDWAPYHDRVFKTPAAHPFDVVRYPFAYIYRRASDVQLYYELANLMLGRPTNTDFVTDERGHLPPRFTLPYPPADGRWHSPYAEVLLEYPAASLPFILGPRLLVSSSLDYGFVLSGLIGLCLVVGVLVALDAARAAGVDAEGLRTRAWLGSGLFLAQGAIAVQRLDAGTALCVVLAVRAVVLRRPGTFGAWAGLATATKFVPALILPAIFASDVRLWRGVRPLARFSVGFGVALVAGFGPMFAFSSHAVADVLAYHTTRGLNCESTFGFLLATWRLVTGTWMPSTITFGSYNLHGTGADVLAAACDERPADERPSRAACAAFAALVVLWLTAKVFSTSYMTWGIPVVLAIPGRLGVRLAWLLLGAMALTQFYVCGHHEIVMQGRPLGLLNLGARHALLVAAGYLAVRDMVRRGPEVATPLAARV